MSSRDSICPVCRTESSKPTRIPSAVPRNRTGQVENTTHCQNVSLYECSRCGRFAVTEIDSEDLRDSELLWAKRSRTRLSALLREHATRSLPSYWLQFTTEPYGPIMWGDLVPIDVDELLERWPRTVPERLDRMLCNLARLSPRGGHRVDFDPEDTPLAFAETAKEAMYNLSCLLKGEWVDDEHSKRSHVTLTPKGWARFEELSRRASPLEDPVFVAMWFGVQEQKKDGDKTEEEMRRMYDEGIKPAVEGAGYRVTRVDLVEHNEWIMDQVLAGIRAAPFVVADFTGHRNGVYFEAGFARGLGKTVIHTCEKEDLKKAHFDTQQLNHVLWTTPDELRKRLHLRIIGSPIGRGPHPPATPGS